MSTSAASACAVTMIGLLHSFRKYLHKPPGTLPSSRKTLLQPSVKLPCSPFHHPSSISVNSPTSKYPFFPMAVSPLVVNRKPSATTIPPTAKHRSSRKVNIRCRFGGKLLPHLSDGALHYVGGRTRITAFKRDTTLQELYCKMEDIYGGPVNICYKLPDQDLTSLVSISSAEDLDTMLDEYDCLLEASRCGYPLLQIFLFPLVNKENSLTELHDAACNDNELSYIEQVNKEINTDEGQTYEEDNIEGATSMLHVDAIGDENGIENTSLPVVHSNLNAEMNVTTQIINPPNDVLNVEINVTPQIINPPNDVLNVEINVTPQIINPPNDVSQASPTCKEPCRDYYITPYSCAMAQESQPDPWNVPGPSNVDSYFGCFRHTQDPIIDEADEDLHNLIELVESVIQSP